MRLRICTGFKGVSFRETHLWALWSDRQNCSHNVSQKVKHIRAPFWSLPALTNSQLCRVFLRRQRLGTCPLLYLASLWLWDGCGRSSTKERKKKHPKKSNTKFFFSAPLAPPQNSSCLHFSYISKRKHSPNTKNFGGWRPLKKVNSGMGFLVKYLCLGVFFGLDLQPHSATCSWETPF